MFHGKKVPTRNSFALLPVSIRFQIVPLLVMQTCVAIIGPLFSLHRLFITTIDVWLPDYHRFEIPPIPQFFDLRKPRVLKLKTVEEVKPAIHLDNRYRLMRNEPMLDEEGCKTDKIGEDETAPPDMKEAAAKFQYKSPYN
ncbi:uncharacterized protein LOC143354596 [Halictus rubicundus]|uniref:uncharacterized protein LOC143354596 n=1 Tax=Halictus rubicundus TaxID=77578 RepID=UPI00403752A5